MGGYYTLTLDGSESLLEEHDTLADAEEFAGEVSSEGRDCAILEVVNFIHAADVHFQMLENINGVRAGIDFPATM